MSKRDFLDVSKLSEAQVERIFEDVWCDEDMLEFWRIKIRLWLMGEHFQDQDVKPTHNGKEKDTN